MYVSVDVEADGPVPGLYSMVSFGAVIVDEKLDKTFYGQTAPISNMWLSEALAISGHTRKEHESFPNPAQTMDRFEAWLKQEGHHNHRPVFISDNPGFDFPFINYYFYAFLGWNPFGWTSRRIGDLYCGMKGNMHAGWKHLRKTKHTHNPVDDAKGNAEAFLEMQKLGLKK